MEFNEIYTWFVLQLTTNDIFAGLAGATIIGSVLVYLRQVPERVYNILRLQFTVELVIHNDDEIYYAVNEWLSSHNYAKKARRLRLTTRYNEENEERNWWMSPGMGMHLLFYCRRPILIKKIKEDNGMIEKIKESLVLTTFGRSQKLLRNLISQSYNLLDDQNQIKIYTWNDYWSLTSTRLKRTRESLVLRENQFEFIEEDIKSFQTSREWYDERGILYKRCYLFSGPPGTGKSSLVVVLASMFNLPVYILNLNSIFSDQSLQNAINRTPQKSILLLEDVDAFSITKERRPEEVEKAVTVSESFSRSFGVTLSGLLNSIDGVASSEGRIIVMTTNYPEKLDKALIRPGRVDIHERLDLIGPKEILKLFYLFYPDDVDVDLKKLKELENLKIKLSPAEVQNLFIEYAKFPNLALLELSKLSS